MKPLPLSICITVLWTFIIILNNYSTENSSAKKQIVKKNDVNITQLKIINQPVYYKTARN
jgi:hypothetical protein